MPQSESLLRRVAAEALGTFAIVFFGCGSIMLRNLSPEHMPIFAISMIFGLVVAAMIYTLGHISGAHFNPAVTLAFASARHFPFQEVLPYWAGQFLGGIGATAVLNVLFGFPTHFGATVPHVGLFAALGWEVLLTFFLMIVIMGVATDTRAVGTMAGMAIGATVMLDAAIGGWATGASMNPARSLAPAIFEHSSVGLWVYFVGPFVGALLGALFYRWLTPTHPSERLR